MLFNFILLIISIGSVFSTDNPIIIQGDILVPEGVDPKHANIVSPKWPSGIVYYDIDAASGFTTAEQTIITNSMRTIESQTGNCLRFVKRTTQSAYVIIRNTNTGCNSYVGKISSQPQQLSLQRPGCVAANVVIHELLHAAGFEHEHCRIDRDNYINIVWSNVDTSIKNAFDKIPSTQASTLGLAYDFYSIMHYRKNAFTLNGQDTIQSKITGVDMSKVGNRNDLSPTDIQKSRNTIAVLKMNLSKFE